MGVAVVARVTDDLRTVCAIEDTVGMGVEPGSSLDASLTPCKASRALREAIVVDRISDHPDLRIRSRCNSTARTARRPSTWRGSTRKPFPICANGSSPHAHPDREIQTDLDIARPLRCDRGRLRQLLSNLIGNAPTDGAKDAPVAVSASLSDGSPHLEVANGREPIEPENLSQPGGGLGPGLCICTEIAKAHGGRMAVTSSAETGTVFGTHLPIVADVRGWRAGRFYSSPVSLTSRAICRADICSRR